MENQAYHGLVLELWSYSTVQYVYGLALTHWYCRYSTLATAGIVELQSLSDWVVEWVYDLIRRGNCRATVIVAIGIMASVHWLRIQESQLSWKKGGRGFKGHNLKDRDLWRRGPFSQRRAASHRTCYVIKIKQNLDPSESQLEVTTVHVTLSSMRRA